MKVQNFKASEVDGEEEFCDETDPYLGDPKIYETGTRFERLKRFFSDDMMAGKERRLTVANEKMSEENIKRLRKAY